MAGKPTGGQNGQEKQARRGMYLFTLVFIFLTIFGVFTQIVTMQNNRFAAMRTSGAQQMLTWHAAAVASARYSRAGTRVFPNWGVAPNPCTIQAAPQTLLAGMPLVCLDATSNPMSLGALIVASPVNAGDTLDMLPPNYDTNLRFNTVIVTDAGGSNTRLAVTFIGPPASADPNEPLPPLGLTGGQLYREMLRLNVEKYNFGYMVNNQLQPAAALFDPASNTTITGAYTLPAALVFNAATNPTGPMRAGALALFTPL